MQSESIAKLSEALAKAQGCMASAAMDGVNPHFRSRYATLASIWDACRKPLSDNGLAVTQTFRMDANGIFLLDTKLSHASGEWMVSEYPITPSKNDPQGLGSAITYARRYTLSAIVGVVADDDDDAESTKATPSALAAKQSQHTSPTPSQPATRAQAQPANGKTNGNGNHAPAAEVPDVVAAWKTPADAYDWAVSVGASDNVHAARNAMTKVVDAHGGKFTRENAAAIYTAFYRDRLKRAQEKALAAIESLDDVPEVDPDGVFA